MAGWQDVPDPTDPCTVDYSDDAPPLYEPPDTVAGALHDGVVTTVGICLTLTTMYGMVVVMFLL